MGTSWVWNWGGGGEDDRGDDDWACEWMPPDARPLLPGDISMMPSIRCPPPWPPPSCFELRFFVPFTCPGVFLIVTCWIESLVIVVVVGDTFEPPPTPEIGLGNDNDWWWCWLLIVAALFIAVLAACETPFRSPPGWLSPLALCLLPPPLTPDLAPWFAGNDVFDLLITLDASPDIADMWAGKRLGFAGGLTVGMFLSVWQQKKI